ncbi:hypothetical protein N7532_010939 [Penicillium argentinense]|uniref:SGNH hydrolase-type esterase domain-containing protein n=1 Tax=Penicillium argentinense TaxID=1131581 RepID=A0A9W9EQI1_9EURO|nr:uncharacterized protein N7532_010939 [Penicillium argentinense]KAJ5086168.1 hypothetical protein N7532_010939 [Penicillium argentinense]
MPQQVEPYNLPPAPFNGSDAVFRNSSLRQTIQVGLAADEIRLRLSNAFGNNDLNITRVAVSLPVKNEAGASAIEVGSSKKVLFSGSPSISIPEGGLAVSDPIELPLEFRSVVTIDLYLEQGQGGSAITGHPGSRTTSFMALGDTLDQHNWTSSSVASTEHWYFISAIEGRLDTSSSSFAIVGDSITDGRGSTTNANNRWPDLLQRRMRQHDATANIAILNEAAGGNRILHDSLGPNAVSRVDRDVLAQPGVQYAMIFEGVNDIGVAGPNEQSQKEIGDQLLVAYQQIATRVQAAGIPFFGATITPFGTSPDSNYTQPYSNVEREKTRQRVNTFIRHSGVFDAVLDFDRVVRDPQAPSQLLSQFDSGDHLHLNAAGCQAIANDFPLGIFV